MCHMELKAHQKLRKAAVTENSFTAFERVATSYILPDMSVPELQAELDEQGSTCLATYYVNIRGDRDGKEN